MMPSVYSESECLSIINCGYLWLNSVKEIASSPRIKKTGHEQKSLMTRPNLKSLIANYQSPITLCR